MFLFYRIDGVSGRARITKSVCACSKSDIVSLLALCQRHLKVSNTEIIFNQINKTSFDHKMYASNVYHMPKTDILPDPLAI